MFHYLNHLVSDLRWIDFNDEISFSNLLPASINTARTIFSMGAVKFYFSTVVLTGGVLGLSLVNSIFVDSMLSDNNDLLEQKIDNLSSEVSKLSQQIEKTKRH